MELLNEEQVETVLSGQTVDRIEAMESIMQEHPQVDIPVTERFINGMYSREIVIPQGTLLTGRVYKEGYMDIMVSGDITVATPQGTKRMTGTNVMEAPPGRKRAGYAFEDTRWITVHRTDQYEPGDMVDMLTFFSMDEYRDFVYNRDRVSYRELIEAVGMTEEQVQAQVHDYSDHADLVEPFDVFVTLAPSMIDGTGLYATRNFDLGDIVGPARTSEGGRTIMGRYSNHSANPNAIMEMGDDGSVWMVATRKINAGDEVTTHYGLTLDKVQGVLCHL